MKQSMLLYIEVQNHTQVNLGHQIVLVVVSTFHQAIKPHLHRIVDFLSKKAKLYMNQKIETLIYLIDHS